MNLSRTKAVALYLTAMVALSISSCVNHIEEEETPLITPGSIPVRISTQILCTQTRAMDNKFENDDAIGIYLLSEGQKLNQARYIDNMHFTCTSSGLIPDKDIYYPNENGICDFFSYYPYQETGIPTDESSIDISIRANQSSSSAYSISDFMTAKAIGITPTKKTINLIHYHKLCQLNIVIKLSEADNIQEFQKNASITINNAYTQATYDFISNEFTALNTPQDLTPNGAWVVDEANRKLSGKKVLLLPQKITNCKVTLHINNRAFTASLPEELKLDSGTSSEITLYCNSKIGIDDIVPSIGSWQEGSKGEATLEEEVKTNSVSISNLDFGRSNVHNIVVSPNIVIGEVCKEYLLNTDIDAQALVFYSANNKNSGTILQVLNKSGDVHGGSISWNIENNTFVYTTGNKAPITSLYADEEGNILFEQPESSLSISSTENVLTDIRGIETITYPIVKIGTQYWMRENLSTTQYGNGGAIAQITTLTQIKAGYYLKKGNYYYSKAAVVKELAPQGWKVPTDKEWEILKSYINNTAAVLKMTHKWIASAEITTANNQTEFNAQPIGFFNKKKDSESSLYDYENKSVAYWSMGASPNTLSQYGILIKADDNAVRGSQYNDFCGYSIRCIKK